MSAKTLLLPHGDFPYVRESGKGEVTAQLLSLVYDQNTDTELSYLGWRALLRLKLQKGVVSLPQIQTSDKRRKEMDWHPMQCTGG